MYISLQEPVLFCKRVSHLCKGAFWNSQKSALCQIDYTKRRLHDIEKLEFLDLMSSGVWRLQWKLSYTKELLRWLWEHVLHGLFTQFTVETVIYQRGIALRVSHLYQRALFVGNCSWKIGSKRVCRHFYTYIYSQQHTPFAIFSQENIFAMYFCSL